MQHEPVETINGAANKDQKENSVLESVSVIL